MTNAENIKIELVYKAIKKCNSKKIIIETLKELKKANKENSFSYLKKAVEDKLS